MKLYDYFRSSAAYRVRIALNLKGIAPERAFVHLRKGAQRDESYLALNPQGLVPALVIDGGDVLTQSLAIIEYLDETHPSRRCCLPTPRARARVRGIALAIACDIHPLDNLRVLRYLTGTAGRLRRAEGRLVQVLDRHRPRGAGNEARARQGDGALLPRRRADARRHLPRAADCQRAPRFDRLGAVSDAYPHRGRVPRAAGVRRRRAGEAAGCGS